MRSLLHRYASKATDRVYVHKLLSAFEYRTGQTQLLEPLSERELQVLQLLTTHLTVPEIALKIHLAPTTVRTHIRNIFRKLDVHGRMEAVLRAEEIGLL
jgi:LuxR family maltose regulon positive regulatory protein